MQKQVLIGRAISIHDRLYRKRNFQEKTQITFNWACYPVFKNGRRILQELDLSLTSDQAFKKVFSEVSINGFKSAKIPKDHLVRTVLTPLDTEDRSKPCGGPNCSCEVCELVKDTSKFKKAESGETFDIL